MLTAAAPLVVGPGVLDSATSLVAFPVTLSSCPEAPAPLPSVRAAVLGRTLTTADGDPRELVVAVECNSRSPPLPLNLVVGCDCGAVRGSGHLPLASLLLLSVGIRRRRGRG